MGDVIASVKVMPTSTEIDLDEIKDAIERSIPGKVELKGFQEKPVAFGLVALHVTVEMPDEGGNLGEDLEAAIAGLDGVESAEITDVGRAL